MENEIYEKDYGEEFRERSDKSEGKDFLDTLMEVGFFQKYQEEMNKIPKRVVPKEKADYEYLLGPAVRRKNPGRGRLSEMAGDH